MLGEYTVMVIVVILPTVAIASLLIRIMMRKGGVTSGHTRESNKIYRVVRIQGESKYRAAKVHSAHVKHQKEE